jgi:hypothetical protein
MVGARVTNTNGPALGAHGLRVDGDVFFEQFTATGRDEYGID